MGQRCVLLGLCALSLTACTHEGRKNLEAAKAQQMEKYRAELAECERAVHETDSMLSLLVPAINQEAEGLVYERTDYDLQGRWYADGTQPEQNIDRSYLRAAVDEVGVVQLISTYAGPRHIDHTALRLTASDGTFCTTDTLPLTSDNNYHYTVAGTAYEAVTFLSGTGARSLDEAKQRANGVLKYDTDGGLTAFIVAHADDARMSVTLLGGSRPQNYVLPTRDVERIVQTLRLATLLQQRLANQQRQTVSANKVKYLRERIASKEVADVPAP